MKFMVFANVVLWLATIEICLILGRCLGWLAWQIWTGGVL